MILFSCLLQIKLQKCKTEIHNLAFEGTDAYIKGQSTLGRFSMGRFSSSQHFCQSVKPRRKLKTHAFIT